MMNRKIIPNRYASSTSLSEIGLLDEVMLYVNRIGWGNFIMMQSPSYVEPTYEFISSFSFNEHTLMLNFHLEN